jgi:uncharacterized protein
MRSNPVGAPASLALYLVVVFLGAALLGPLLYLLVLALADAVPALAGLARHPLHRYVQRAMLVLAVAGLPWLLRRLELRGWSRLGLAAPRSHLRALGLGLALGFASLAIVALVPLAAGVRQLRPGIDAGHVAAVLAGAALTATVVSFLEELLFRGVVFGGLRRAWSWPAALAASSGFYAIVHFFARPPRPDTVAWYSGLVQLGQMLAGFADLALLVPGFFNLAIAGAILGFAYQRSGTLYLPIGIHAGWIFWLKLYGAIVVAPSGSGDAVWLWGTRRLVDGWAACLVFVLGMLAYLAVRRMPRRPVRAVSP